MQSLCLLEKFSTYFYSIQPSNSVVFIQKVSKQQMPRVFTVCSRSSFLHTTLETGETMVAAGGSAGCVWKRNKAEFLRELHCIHQGQSFRPPTEMRVEK
ncbi:hypothetical protein DMENIID0001_119670 [Sergentomyia squamirostris]